MFYKALGVLLGAALLVPVLGQSNFSKADSGWVPLFNGEDFEGIYGRLYQQDVTPEPDPSWVILHPGTDTATIRGSNTNRQGHIGTKENYSHYRMRVVYRHDQAGDQNNAGITYHTDESKPRMSGNWPFSIECQMMQREPGSAYSIAGLAFDTRASGSSYAPTGGSPVTACVGTGCNRRNYNANPIIRGGTHWQKMEIIIRGSDTAWHLVNDQVVFKLWNMREKTSNGFGENVSSGAIGLQAEGALINYRHWEIMELPENSPTNYLQRLFLTNLNGGEILLAGETYEITWEHIGEFDEVTLEFTVDSGATWMPIATAPNDGSYEWTVPDSLDPSEGVKVRVRAESWVQSDESDAFFSLDSDVPVGKFDANGRRVTFSIPGQNRIFQGRGDFDRIEVYSFDGKLYWSTQVTSRAVHWDGRLKDGEKAPSGLYLARFRGSVSRQVPFVLR